MNVFQQLQRSLAKDGKLPKTATIKACVIAADAGPLLCGDHARKATIKVYFSAEQATIVYDAESN